MKKIKRAIAVLLITVMSLTTLTACGGKFTCDICGKEKSGKKYTSEILGQTVNVCKDCKKEMDEALEALGSLF